MTQSPRSDGMCEHGTCPAMCGECARPCGCVEALRAERDAMRAVVEAARQMRDNEDGPFMGDAVAPVLAALAALDGAR